MTDNQLLFVLKVFITSEQSVFLHRQGVGWLIENNKDVICFKRVA